MSLDKDRLGNAIADRVITIMGTTPAGPDEAALRTLMKALADEIIIELTNADVAAGAFLDSVAGSVTGIGGPLS